MSAPASPVEYCRNASGVGLDERAGLLSLADRVDEWDASRNVDLEIIDEEHGITPGCLDTILNSLETQGFISCGKREWNRRCFEVLCPLGRPLKRLLEARW